MLSDKVKNLSKRVALRCWGREAVVTLDGMARQGSSEKGTRAKGRAAVGEVREAIGIQDLRVLCRI